MMIQIEIQTQVEKVVDDVRVFLAIIDDVFSVIDIILRHMT
jgi:hypothetical protein